MNGRRNLSGISGQIVPVKLGPNRGTTEYGNVSAGEGLVCRPLDTLVVTSIYGNRYHPIKKTVTRHTGIDLRGRDRPVMALCRSKVAEVGYNVGSGMYIVLVAGDYEFVYGHLSEIYVLSGQNVRCGEYIGRTGDSGAATAGHLHFSVKYKGGFSDPYPFLAAM